MAKLSHPVESSSYSQIMPPVDLAPVIKPAIGQVNNMEIDDTHVDQGNTHASIGRDMHAPDLPIDVAVEAMLAVNDIDAVTPVGLDEMRNQASEIDPRAVLALLYSRSLAHGLLSFVTPRLRYPDVLRAEQHGALLERLAGTLSARPEISVAREGLVALQQELQRLIRFRQNRNSLIQG
ncbi:hypothetical protein Q2941_11040 [Bradyrhizobium sp. UFLA05-153]